MPVSVERVPELIVPLTVLLAVSLLCGGAIGIERELRHKTAGLKTVVLMCVGSALYAGLSRAMVDAAGSRGEVTRIAGQVITGIGFIGGGTILHAEGVVIGLTSAAVIWVVAAIGLLIGAGYPILGVASTVAVLGMLFLLTFVETRFLGHCDKSLVTVRFADDSTTRPALAQLLARHGVDLDSYNLDVATDGFVLRVPVCRSHPEHRTFIPELWTIPGVRAVHA